MTFVPIGGRGLRSAPLDRTLLEKIAKGLSTPDPKAEIQRDRKGEIIYDVDLKDTEIVPYKESIEDYMAREVLPHLPGAKAFFLEDLTAKKPVIKTGAEFPFTRYFYKYVKHQDSEVILSEIKEIESVIFDERELTDIGSIYKNLNIPVNEICSSVNSLFQNLYPIVIHQNSEQRTCLVQKLSDGIGLLKREIELLQSYKQCSINDAIAGRVKASKKNEHCSAISWLGAIPSKWEIKKIGSIYEKRSKKVSDKEYQPLSVTMKGIVPQLSTVAKSKDSDGRKLVCVGDFAINSRSDRRGACGVSRFEGSVSSVNIVLRPKERVFSAYFDYMFHTDGFADEFYRWGKGIDSDVWSTHWPLMKKISVPFPPVEEQKSISLYIVSFVAVIDGIVAERKGLLKRLTSLQRLLV